MMTKMESVSNIAEEARYREGLVRAGVPNHLHDGLVRYLVYGIRPGHFLTAVLENDLRAAVIRADAESRAALCEVVTFLHTEAPMFASGSPALVAAYVEARQAEMVDMKGTA